MEDEDYVPTRHPLQLYLKDLNLSDANAFDEVNTTHGRGFPKLRIVYRQVRRIFGFLLSAVPHSLKLAELIRLCVIKRIHSVVTKSDATNNRNHHYEMPITEHYYNLNKLRLHRHQSTFIFQATVVSCILLGSIQYSSHLLRYVSCILLPSAFGNTCAIFTVLSASALFQSSYGYSLSVQQTIRSVVLFLQELEVCANVGSNSESLVPLYPHMEATLLRLLYSYANVLVDLSSEFVDSIWSPDHTVSCGMSPEQLNRLKGYITSNVTPASGLKESKMLREIVGVLSSELLDKLAAFIAGESVYSLRSWARFNTFLMRFRKETLNLSEKLEELDQLRQWLEQGGSEDDHAAQSEVVAKPPEIDGSTLLVRRMIRDIHSRLLISVKFVNDLRICITDNGAINEDFRQSLEMLRVQLQSCESIAESVEMTVDLGQTTPNASAYNKGDEFDTYRFSNRALTEAATRVPTAEDIEPEDDALEDVAIGEISDTECGPEDDVSIGLMNPFAPLHVTVLKELRSVINSRRIAMEEREQRALERRGMSSQKPSSSIESSPEPEMPESDEALVMVNSNTARVQFYSAAIDQDTTSDVVKPTRSIFQAQSSVSKRFRLFNQYAGPTLTHTNGHATDVSVVESSMELEASASPTEPQIEATKPTICTTELAAALMKGRRQLGLSSEDIFVADASLSVSDSESETSLSDLVQAQYLDGSSIPLEDLLVDNS